MNDTDLDLDLRALDVAGGGLEPKRRPREALLREILATQPDARLLTRHTRRTLRWVVPLAGAVTLAGVLVVARPPGHDAAYASWTPAPIPVTGTTLTTATAACLDEMRRSVAQNAEAGSPSSPVQMATARTVVAEKRGNFLFLAVATKDGSTTECFFEADHPDHVTGITGGLSTAASPAPKVLAGREIETSGAGMSGGPEGNYAFTQGRVGVDVTGVRLRTEGRTITATVSDGYYAAWWPTAGREPNATMPSVAYDLTLRDGTVARDIRGVGQSAATPGPRQIGPVSRGGAASAGTGGGTASTISAAVGEDVAAVTVRVSGRSIPARVRAGSFLAQLPAQDSDSPLRYDITLRDGTVLTDQQPMVRATGP